MNESKMREALIAAHMAGNQHGHNSTVEGYWSEAEDVAEEYADEALAQPAESARQRYDRLTSDDKPESAIEALRFFLSLSLDGQDWLDVEPFLDAVAQQPAAGVELTDGMALVPTRLTAENGAKSALSGEFNVAVETDCDDCDDCELEEICQTCLGEGYTVRYEPVSWTMIKDIWAAGISHFAKQGGAV